MLFSPKTHKISTDIQTLWDLNFHTVESLLEEKKEAARFCKHLISTHLVVKMPL